jgi:hypothetical protein
LIAELARDALQVLTRFLRGLPNFESCHAQLPLAVPAEVLDELLIGIALLAAKLVIEMGGNQPGRGGRRQFMESTQQGQAVRTAGDCNNKGAVPDRFAV